MKPRKTLALLLALFVFGSPAARAAEITARISPEAKADFEWFSTLGFPDVKGLPFVRVATGSWSRSGDDPPANQYVNSFLLASNQDSFTILSLDLVQRRLTNSIAGTAEHQRVGFSPLVLKNDANQLLTNHALGATRENLWRGLGKPITERAEVFVLGWACWRQGLELESERLYRLATTIPQRSARGPEMRFRTALEKDLGHAMMWRAVVAFGDISASRRQLLAQFQFITTNYPNSEHFQRTTQTVAVLTRMIAEDVAHAKSAPKNPDGLSVESRVSELIFRLRDQNGQQWGQPGWCDIFMDVTGATNTAAHELVRTGYPAVPQLIVALEDDTFTRSVGYHRDFYFSHTVLTVGDCAAAILERIAGRSFYRPASTSGYMSKEGKKNETRRVVEDWWAQFQKGGEKQTLIAATESGDANAPAQAALLVARYPDSALAPLIKGTRACTNAWTRVRMVQLFEKLEAPEALDFLLDELRNGSFPEARVAAARVLHGRGRAEAVATMIHEWEGMPENRPPALRGPTELIRFLAQADSPEAIRALGRHSHERSLHTRMAIVEAVGNGNMSSHGFDGMKPRSLATREAVEELLTAALADTDQDFGMSGTRMNKSYVDPRICDMAGFFLNQLWPERHDFDLSASLRVRDRQRIECQNTWRMAHNLPALPLPAKRNPPVTRNESTKVTVIEWTADSVRPSETFAASIAALKDKALSAADFVGLLTAYSAEPLPGTAGLEIKAIKDEDLTGVALSIRLLPGTPPKAVDATWHINEQVSLGRKNLHGSAGNGERRHHANAKGWDHLAVAAATAVAGPPETPFIISVRLATSPP